MTKNITFLVHPKSWRSPDRSARCSAEARQMVTPGRMVEFQSSFPVELEVDLDRLSPAAREIAEALTHCIKIQVEFLISWADMWRQQGFTEEKIANKLGMVATEKPRSRTFEGSHLDGNQTPEQYFETLAKEWPVAATKLSNPA